MTIEILKTDRLILRSARDSDLDALYDIVFSVAEVMVYAFEGKTFSKQEADNFFSNYFDHDGNGKQLGVLTLKDADAIIGFAGLLECSVLDQRDYEIGFVLGRAFWGKGYATEIGHAQIKYGLDVVGLNRLLALVAPDNEASISVLHKIGMLPHSSIDIKGRGAREIYIAPGRS